MCNFFPKISSNNGISMENWNALVVNKRSMIDSQNGNRPAKKRRTNFPSLHENYMSMDKLSWGEFHEDLLERVLARLPVSKLFSFRSVCKRWNSILDSPSFLDASSEVPFRAPWFYMVDSKFEQGMVYDTEVYKWHHIKVPHVLSKNVSKPIASAGGLICFESAYGKFIVCNPLTGQCRKLPNLHFTETIHAVTMVAYKKSYKVIVIYGIFPTFVTKVYDSSTCRWSEPSICWNMKEKCGTSCLKQNMSNDDGIMYFLNKGGNIVASDVQRSPSKEYSSILTSANGEEEIVYFFNRGGNVVACNTHKGLWYELPPLSHPTLEYSLDIVNCGGRMLVVVLLDFLESSTVRIWEFDEANSEWKQALAMPVSMSHRYFGMKADLNCTAYDNLMMICISSCEFSCLVLCNIIENSWLELPLCSLTGDCDIKKFVSAFPFEPRLEAPV
ncbi:F-box only protein 13 [Cryptomeria japonica]|uniref:F-box only protein 13 n=1 Tax=Cryptomeria japonica TaxID=3369 RepID=UPI0027DA536B|nr:F-box only protein 13 [Cryptomeria japonica]XP_057817636.2 F-box only protein 13 [Cryptomeria japonica]